MIVDPLDVAGTFVLRPRSEADRHGFFSRGFARQVLEDHGLEPTLMRSDILVCHEQGTVWGPRFQVAPDPEAVFLRCTRGAALAVVCDPRDLSRETTIATLRLDPEAREALYVQGGLAYGFQTLEAETEIFFQASEAARPAQDRGLPWRAAWLAAAWPLPVTGAIEPRPAGIADAFRTAYWH